MDRAWKAAREIPGYLVEDEARFLGLMAACAPRGGSIVEIGSFKGKSTVILAMVAGHYGLGPIVAIDPHNFHSPELQEHRTAPGASSYEEFLSNLQRAGVAELVEVHRAYSRDVAAGWSRPIRFLWIDGDHGYDGAKSDLDGYAPTFCLMASWRCMMRCTSSPGRFEFLWKMCCVRTATGRRGLYAQLRGLSFGPKTAHFSAHRGLDWSAPPLG